MLFQHSFNALVARSLKNSEKHSEHFGCEKPGKLDLVFSRSVQKNSPTRKGYDIETGCFLFQKTLPSYFSTPAGRYDRHPPKEENKHMFSQLLWCSLEIFRKFHWPPAIVWNLPQFRRISVKISAKNNSHFGLDRAAILAPASVLE